MQTTRPFIVKEQKIKLAVSEKMDCKRVWRNFRDDINYDVS